MFLCLDNAAGFSDFSEVIMHLFAHQALDLILGQPARQLKGTILINKKIHHHSR